MPSAGADEAGRVSPLPVTVLVVALVSTAAQLGVSPVLVEFGRQWHNGDEAGLSSGSSAPPWGAIAITATVSCLVIMVLQLSLSLGASNPTSKLT